MKIHWKAIVIGLYYYVLLVIMMKIFEALIFSNLPYGSRAVGWVLSIDEYVVQNYGPLMLAGYVFVHTVKIGVASYITAQIAGERFFLHAALMVLVVVLFSWLLFRPVIYAPVSETIGLIYSLFVAYLVAGHCKHRMEKALNRSIPNQ